MMFGLVTVRIIMSSVKISGALLSVQNSFVTKEVRPHNCRPAKEICKKFNEETIQMLLALKWWDWDVQKKS